jgi:hypothetical protein
VSLVLEALRKQEAEQNPEAARTIAFVRAERRRRYFWSGMVAAALVLNAAVLIWLFGNPDLIASRGPAGSLAGTASQTAAPVPDPAAGAPERREAPGEAAAATVGEDLPGVAVAPGATADAPGTAIAAATLEPPPRRLERITLDRLPSGPRSRFPGIVISTHVYAEDRDLRAVVANGERLGEGDHVRGLPIDEITANGVVLEFESWLVEVPVFSDWQ